MARGQDGGYLYSRDGKLIPIDETHHEYVAQHPKLFFSDDEIATLCKNYGVTELRELCHDEDFIEESGPIFEHFTKSLTKKCWLKVRNIGLNSQTYITCYMFKRDYDTIMNLLTKVPDIINDNLHIEGVVDEDWITTDKSSAEKDLLERMCEAVETEERIQEASFVAKIYNLDDSWDEYYIDENGEPVDYPEKAKVFDNEQDAEDWAEENRYYNWGAYASKLSEAVEDFPRNTRAMYRFAKRRHDDTGAIRKVSKQPYWVHPEGVAKIVMEHGGSDLEIKAAMAHDVLEDTGESYDDIVEKFGEDVASIVKELTNDKDEIAKVGKEKYISEELCRLSPEALTVKLADMLYNMKDSPTEKNYERMRKNVAFLMMNRQLDGKHLELAQEIMEV